MSFRCVKASSMNFTNELLSDDQSSGELAVTTQLTSWLNVSRP